MATTAQLAKKYSSVLARASDAKNIDNQEVVEKLVAHLKETGRLKLLPDIMRSLKEIRFRKLVNSPRVEVSREEDITEALAGAASAGVQAEVAVINKSLVRGWRVRTSSILVDYSAKRALLELYRNIIR